MAQTLYEKLWSSHLVREESDGTGLLYIDRHLVHETHLFLPIFAFLSDGRAPKGSTEIVVAAEFFADPPNEAGGIGAVDHAMVVGQ